MVINTHRQDARREDAEVTCRVEFDVKPPSKPTVIALLRNLKLVAIRRKRTVVIPSLPELVPSGVGRPSGWRHNSKRNSGGASET